MVAAEHLDKKSFAKKLDELYDKLLSIGFSPPQIERALRATSLNGDAEGRKWEYPRTEMMVVGGPQGVIVFTTTRLVVLTLCIST